MSVELPYMAVLWDANRTIDFGSSMNTIDLDQFSVTRTAIYDSSMGGLLFESPWTMGD